MTTFKELMELPHAEGTNRILVNPKVQRVWSEFAEQLGYTSLSAFIRDTINERIQADTTVEELAVMTSQVFDR